MLLTAQSSTDAIVRPADAPAEEHHREVVTRCEVRSPIAGELVTTVSCRSVGSRDAMPLVVLPASRRIEPCSGSSLSALRAIRFLLLNHQPVARCQRGSKSRRSTAIAPPCTRRTTPACSRVLRSRRIVSAETSNPAGQRLDVDAPDLAGAHQDRLLALLCVHLGLPKPTTCDAQHRHYCPNPFVCQLVMTVYF